MSKENEFMTNKKHHYVIEATWAKMTSENDHTVEGKLITRGIGLKNKNEVTDEILE